MYVNQKLSILFYRKMKKKTSDHKVPLYVRVTIDGISDEISTGLKITPDNWDQTQQVVFGAEPSFKQINKRIGQMATDLERHFNLVQAKQQIATSASVLQSYKTPVNGKEIKDQKAKNLVLSKSLDELVWKYIDYFNKREIAFKHGNVPPTQIVEYFEEKKKDLSHQVETLTKQARVIFDDKSWKKTLVLALDEHILWYLQLVSAGHRAATTLEKNIGKKQRFVEFLTDRYNRVDIPLDELEVNFLEELKTYLMVSKEVIQNTAMKYSQRLKEILIRANNNGWISSNVFKQYKCRYTKSRHDWLTVKEMEKLYSANFVDERLEITRDIYLFCSFTGLAYGDVFSLSPGNIIEGVDGKKWISKNRVKTKADETLPLLPLPLQLIEKYRNNKHCLRWNVLLPVPSNQEYNRALKDLAQALGIEIVLRSHKARFYFANEVLFNNDVQLKLVARIMGQDSAKSAEIYVEANRDKISKSMATVEDKLFNPDGSLRMNYSDIPPEAKVIKMRAV